MMKRIIFRKQYSFLLLETHQLGAQPTQDPILHVKKDQLTFGSLLL